MPRSMVFDIDVEVPAARMYSLFTKVDYWQDLVAFYLSHSARTEIAHFSSDETGTDVSFTHILSAADLPPIARSVVPGTFIVTREQHFEPFDAPTNRALGRYRAHLPHRSNSPAITFSPTPNTAAGCDWRAPAR